VSDLQEKLDRPQPTGGTQARARFSALLARWGELHVHGDSAELVSMGYREKWHRVSGRGPDSMWALDSKEQHQGQH
jgi:hypothetical protein